MPEATGGVVALFVTDEHDLATVKLPQPADDCLVVAEISISAERHEILDQGGDIILEMRTLRVAGDLRLLPWRQPGISLPQQPVGLLLEAPDLGLDVELARGRCVAKLGDARFELSDRFFEIKESRHEPRRLGRLPFAVNAPTA